MMTGVFSPVALHTKRTTLFDMDSVIELVEYGTLELPYTALSEQQVATLQSRYALQVEVQLLLSGLRRWRLSAQGWVGSIPLDGLVVLIRPKIPLPNLFTLIEVAWDINFILLDGLIGCDSVAAFYDRLAVWLAEQTLVRAGSGLQRDYVQHEESLPYVRGRLRAADLRANQIKLPVAYAQISADISHNQVLYYSLHLILASGLLSDRSLPLVQKAHRLLRSAITLRPFTLSEIDTLSYDRLNDDYRTIHAICRFLIAHVGPLHAPGEEQMLPFLIDMAALFEKFVARWLGQNLPDDLILSTQERSSLADGHLQIAIDLVLVNRLTNGVVCVLDTKWKSAEKPANADIYQICFYANSRHSPTAALIYPSPLQNRLSTTIRDVHLETLVFDVSADIDAAGKQFMIQLEELISRRR